MREIMNLIENVACKQYILSLLPKKNWKLMIQIGTEKIGLSFSKQKIEICTFDNRGNMLICSEEDWTSLIEGEHKLRQCIRLGSTIYKGSFRSLLMLESLLFLQVSTE